MLTQHPTRVGSLPKDLREAAQQAGKDPVYLRQVDPPVTDQVWDRFLAALSKDIHERSTTTSISGRTDVD